eukprot:gnl/Hemi2/18836_TR6240_c0_g1_i2.p1 gnl/Hemi2/18836_TR6240_c0_g1~~gnl/Hemi2/18836_TR6240_c0_g1_i2.p1  ORF type:complete len:318 (+),score=77.76 gnl/Hemi2/18836_TR6240_c0_g1_i2:51-956(+)
MVERRRGPVKAALLAVLKYCLVLPVLWLFKTLWPSRLAVETLRLRVPKYCQVLGLKIVHISDIHYDVEDCLWVRTSERLMHDVVEAANRLEPDIIVLTGDYVQYEPAAVTPLCSRWLSQLRAKYGVFASLGNHDCKKDLAAPMIEKALTEIGITVLENQVVYPIPLSPNKTQRLELVGVGDYFSGNFCPEEVLPALEDAQKDTPVAQRPFRLVLSHNPDSAEVLMKKWRVDLQLSGHSHGGQICFPNGTPVLAWMQKLNMWIRYSVAKRLPCYLYTNRGIATHPPLRLFCSPEVTLIEFTN